MTTEHERPLDRATLVYRHHEQLYRLALLVAGSAEGAATLLERAYRDLPDEAPDPEAALIRALLPRRGARRPWRWHATREDAARALLPQSSADGLLDALAAVTPAARLAIGLHYLCGMSIDEIADLIGDSPDLPAPGQTLGQFRVGAAHALELVPDDADDAMLLDLDRAMDGLIPQEQSVALRRAVLDQPAVRALRDALIALRDLLPRAIPALFAATPPLALTSSLLEPPRQRRALVAPPGRLTRAHAGLALGVLVLVAAIVLLPSLLARRAGPLTVAPRTVGALIDAAVNRFNQAPLSAGVLHEQYRVQVDDRSAYLVERWYDYAAPHRLRLTIKAEGKNDSPLMEISSDGRTVVQYRYGSDVLDFRERQVDAYVSQDEAQAVIPILRSEPSATIFVRDVIDFIDISPRYLGQARSSNASFLGQTSVLGRPAFLVTYHTNQPLGRQRPQATPASRDVQVVLTIDAQTYGLLDIAILAGGEAEGTARHPLQTQQIEVVPSVASDLFTLPDTAGVIHQTGVQSAHVPDIPNSRLIPLEDALRNTAQPLLAPSQLPDTNMRALALALDDSSGGEVVLLYEGEFQSLLLAPGGVLDRDLPPSEEHSAGAFRYRILPPFRQQPGTLGAEVYRPEAPNEHTMVMLVDEYATAAEREARLQGLIASLTPLTEQSLPALKPMFKQMDVAGG